MRLDLLKKPEGEWASFGEPCGVGDAATKEFKLPFPASEARSVIVLQNFNIVGSDDRLVVMNDKDGTILRDEPNGYQLQTRGEEMWVVFDRAPALEVKITVSCLGRKSENAFKVLPMSTLLGKKISAGQPAIFRGPAKDRDKVTSNDLQEAGRVSFMELVQDWHGIQNTDGTELPCTPEMKKAFLDSLDAMFFGIFVSNRASAIRSERINQLDKDSSD